MTKENLKNGHLVVLRNTRHGIVIGDKIIILNPNNYTGRILLISITNDLKCQFAPNLDIMEVYKFNNIDILFHDNFNSYKDRRIYKREEIKEHTMSELVVKLGYSFKLIK